MADYEEVAPTTPPVDELVTTPTIPPIDSALSRQEPAPSRFPPSASTGIFQGLRRRRLSWRTAALLLVLALLILASARGLYATMHLSPARTRPTATATGLVTATATGVVDFASGMKKWAYRTRRSVSSPAVVNGVVYYGTFDSLYALDAASGAKKWTSYQTGGEIDSSPAVVNGVVYVGSCDGKEYALDAASGAKKWAYHTGGRFSSPAVVNGVVYVGSLDGNVYALDAASGTKKWTYQTGDSVNTLPVVAGGVVYVGSNDGYLYALHVPGT